jgi:hypothetical protein
MRGTVVSLRLVEALITLFVLAVSAQASARPPSLKVQCKQAAERAQMYRNEGKLLSAREELHRCVRPACPAVVRTYCTRWFEEVEADLPTIVLKVKDRDGNDLSDATVSIDGQVLDSWQGGLPIALDPGSHTIGCTRPENPAIETSVLLGTAEKRRLITLTLESSTPNPEHLDPPLAAQLSEAPRARKQARRPSAAAWTVGALSLAAWGSFAYFGYTGRNELSDMRDTCAGHCPQSKVDSAWDRLIIADVSLGLAVVGTGLSTWLFVSSLRNGKERPRNEASVVPSPFGASFSYRRRF